MLNSEFFRSKSLKATNTWKSSSRSLTPLLIEVVIFKINLELHLLVFWDWKIYRNWRCWSSCSCLPVTDYKCHYRALILQSWNLLCKSGPTDELFAVKLISTPWTSSRGNSWREEEVIFATLRIVLTYSIRNTPADSLYFRCHEENPTVYRFHFLFSTPNPLLLM